MEHFGASVTAEQIPTIVTHCAVVLTWVRGVVLHVQVVLIEGSRRVVVQVLEYGVSVGVHDLTKIYAI